MKKTKIIKNKWQYKDSIYQHSKDSNNSCSVCQSVSSNFNIFYSEIVEKIVGELTLPNVRPYHEMSVNLVFWI